MKLKLDNYIHYIAEDENGAQYFYERSPVRGSSYWLSDGYSVTKMKFDLGSNWKQSLHEVVRDDEGYVTLIKCNTCPDILIDTKVIVWDDITPPINVKDFLLGGQRTGKFYAFHEEPIHGVVQMEFHPNLGITGKL